jgi:hypothetical protein
MEGNPDRAGWAIQKTCLLLDHARERSQVPSRLLEGEEQPHHTPQAIPIPGAAPANLERLALDLTEAGAQVRRA